MAVVLVTFLPVFSLPPVLLCEASEALAAARPATFGLTFVGVFGFFAVGGFLGLVGAFGAFIFLSGERDPINIETFGLAFGLVIFLTDLAGFVVNLFFCDFL